MRWPMSGKSNVDGYDIYYSGEDSPQHRNGVAIIISPEAAKSVKNAVLLSDRIIMLQLQTTTVNMNLIQVYAPTSDCDEEVLDQFYELRGSPRPDKKQRDNNPNG